MILKIILWIILVTFILGVAQFSGILAGINELGKDFNREVFSYFGREIKVMFGIVFFTLASLVYQYYKS